MKLVSTQRQNFELWEWMTVRKKKKIRKSVSSWRQRHNTGSFTLVVLIEDNCVCATEHWTSLQASLVVQSGRGNAPDIQGMGPGILLGILLCTTSPNKENPCRPLWRWDKSYTKGKTWLQEQLGTQRDSDQSSRKNKFRINLTASSLKILVLNITSF